MRVERLKDKEWAVMTLAKLKMTEEIAQDQRVVREILGLKQDVSDFRVVFGSAPAGEDEVAMITRSMLEILIDISASVDVPPSHVQEGRTHRYQGIRDRRCGRLSPHDPDPERAATPRECVRRYPLPGTVVLGR